MSGDHCCYCATICEHLPADSTIYRCAKHGHPPLECALCGLACWNDDSVIWITVDRSAWDLGLTETQPYCVANGCAERITRIEARRREATP